jgi:hypothetical protein
VHERADRDYRARLIAQFAALDGPVANPSLEVMRQQPERAPSLRSDDELERLWELPARQPQRRY